MTKLFNKFLTISVAAFSALSLSACSDKIAGTAEEPNQIAQGTESSSSADRTIESSSDKSTGLPNEFPIITSSATSPTPSVEITSSSRKEEDGYAPIHMDPEPSSSSAGGFEGAGNPDFGNPDCQCKSGTACYCGSDGKSAYTLDDYLKNYNITEVSYDDNVLAYNVTFKSCDVSQETCFESPGIAEFRKIGLHKAATPKEFNDLSFVFPTAAKFMGGSLHEVDGCPLYVLNINETSPAVHILTKITKDTLTVATFYDNCDYERRPFDMHVGFLFSYCGELSEKLEIVMTNKLNEAMTPCGSEEYKEYISKKILPTTATFSPIQD
ncbi:hypothetical protein [Fibrobacter sp. UBA4297]|uniref:hypothetical protein n=1 Tax=Fibrobacter sp. UBA4297 TaxID=1946536 RepID=UPI0025C1490F|nr:hypothetical protein [Fibrobacter sp. UBA4297]